MRWEWSPGKMETFVDDKSYFVATRSEADREDGWRAWPFDKPFHLLLNIAVGGVWGGQQGVDESIWPIGETAAHEFSLDGLEAHRSYPFTVQAVDIAGNKSGEAAISVTTELANPAAVPGRVEAEAYLFMNGVDTEPTTDEGGGSNVGWIDDGDWLDYAIEARHSGPLRASFRIASESREGDLQLLDSEGGLLTTVAVPATGGWQRWQTIESGPFQLKEGVQQIRLHAKTGGFNLNWFEIIEADEEAAGANE